ncbi:3D-(3,5/4)-trihydroxycyclohexane-1,2-dione hydrolase [Spirochaetota bacterium]|nr:3D-(3,5/4)-trihydroxycyclohexane-1,2-dione hydrolase [Spirochaetota bacterium]
MNRTRMTMAQAIVKFLDRQYVSLDGVETKFVEGVFTIFGHGCCVGLGEALSPGSKPAQNLYSHSLTVYQGHNEQGMAHAAIAYAKEHNRRKIMPCISSIGPGATNMVTAAATATVNRLPALFLPGDIFACRQPDPVLQQLESTRDFSLSVNDAFKPVCQFWDRITRPEQIMTSLLHAFRVLTDPRETGAVCIALAQDVQGEAYDYPDVFFERRTHIINRYPCSSSDVNKIIAALCKAKKPVVICGGGVRYSEAHEAFKSFIDTLNIPFVETQVGKSIIPYDHSLNCGGVGVTGTLAANKIINEADFVLAVGTRLNDFVTASKSSFTKAKVMTVNVQPYDGIKLGAHAIIADAKDTLLKVISTIKEKPVYTLHSNQAKKYISDWNAEKELLYKKTFTDGLSQLAALHEINKSIPANAIVVAASGSLPGDMERLWEATHKDTYHLEYGFSCMGYEVTGALGAKLAHQQEREVFALVGDGAYMLLHSELFTSIQEGAKINILLFDNSGYHCIDNLQRAQGINAFACEFKYRDKASGHLTGKNIPVDYASNARSYGCETWTVTDLKELKTALQAAAHSTVSTLIDIKVAKKSMTGGYDAWWRVGTPEVSKNDPTLAAFNDLAKKRSSALRDY